MERDMVEEGWEWLRGGGGGVGSGQQELRRGKTAGTPDSSRHSGSSSPPRATMDIQSQA